MNERLQVLVVEDNPGDLDLIREMLTEPGAFSLSIEPARRLSEAIARLDGNNIDLVLLDLGLPDSSGIDTFLKLKAAAPEVPTIILSGNSDQEIALTAVKEGAQDYLVKGRIDGNLLVRSIQYAIERKAAETALRESEANLKRAQEIAKMGSWTVELPAGAMSWSAEMYRIYGVSPETFTMNPESFINLAHPDDRSAMQAWITAFIAGKRPGELEFRIVHPDGTVRHISGRGELISDADGKPTRAAGTAQDITERKRAEEQLADKQRFLEIVTGMTPDIVYLYNAQQRQHVFFNKDLKHLLGYSSEEIKQSGADLLLKRVHPDDYAEVLKHTDILAHTQSDDVYQLEYRIKDKNDHYLWFYVREQVYQRDQAHQPEILFGICQDITERKLAEATLAANETKYRELFQQFQGLLDAIPDSLMLLDTDLKVLWANRAAVETIGGTAESLVGRHCYALWYNRSAACDPCPVERSFTTGQPQSEIVTRPDGRIWDIRTVPLVDAQGRTARVIEVKRDITEHRKLEDQLRQAQKLEGIGQLAGGIAHDFNNVLGAMIGFAGVLQMKIVEGDPLRHYVDEIVAAGERGADISRQILIFSRQQVTELKPEGLNNIVRGLEKMLRRLLPESIDLAYDLSGEDPVILADAGQLGQVLLNLVTNARDAIVGNGRIGIATGRQSGLLELFSAPSPSPLPADAGRGTLFGISSPPPVHGEGLIIGISSPPPRGRGEGEGAQGSGEPGEYAVLTVSDSGHGMDAATRARIFEPFFTTKELGKGTGLGLAVVHGIVKQHKGYVNVYSEVGKGTVIRVYLPLAAAAVAAEAAAAPAEIAGGSETILVAEDDTVLRKLTRTVLCQYGYTVIEAEDGVDAVTKFAANKDAIRLVILDGLMPKMGGVDALGEIRRRRPDVKALFMSGYDDKVFSGGVLRDKATAFIQKPVMIADLLRAVREALDG